MMLGFRLIAGSWGWMEGVVGVGSADFGSLLWGYGCAWCFV